MRDRPTYSFGFLDGLQFMFRVKTRILARFAEIVIRTDFTLVAYTSHWPLAAVTGDVRVKDLSVRSLLRLSLVRLLLDV